MSTTYWLHSKLEKHMPVPGDNFDVRLETYQPGSGQGLPAVSFGLTAVQNYAFIRPPCNAVMSTGNIDLVADVRLIAGDPHLRVQLARVDFDGVVQATGNCSPYQQNTVGPATRESLTFTIVDTAEHLGVFRPHDRLRVLFETRGTVVSIGVQVIEIGPFITQSLSGTRLVIPWGIEDIPPCAAQIVKKKSLADILSGGKIRLPSWGRCFWQDPNDGELFLAYASGDTEIDYVTSVNSGISWQGPTFLTSCDDFSVDDNFDLMMDMLGHIHIGYQRQAAAKYRFLGKIPGGGWDAASGNGEILVNASHTQTAPGFQGSLLYSPGPVGVNDWEDTAAHYPIVRYVYQSNEADNKARVVIFPWPYDGSETGGAGDWFSDSGTQNITPGPSNSKGGFPTWSHTHGTFPTNENVALTWGSESGTLVLGTRGFGFWAIWDELKILPEGGNNGIDTGSGYIPLTQHMTFASGAHNNSPKVGNNWPILTANESGIEMYCTGSEPGGGGSFIARVDSHYVGTNGPQDRAPGPGGWPLGTLASGMRGTASADDGINMDISWGDKPGEMYLYFQDHDPVGIQRISRIKVTCEAASPNILTGGFNAKTFTGWRFSSLDHPVSGQIPEAQATKEYCGGSDDEGDRFFSHWRKFKALRHPVGQNEGVSKREMVVTLGDSIKPSGSQYLVATDFTKTVRAVADFILPTFEFETTLPPSGTNGLFVGIARDDVGNSLDDAFDGDTSTGTTLANDDFFILEFTRPILITRMEMLWNKFFLTAVPSDVAILASLDDSDYRLIKTVTSIGSASPTTDNLYQWTSDSLATQFSPANQNKIYIDPFIAKYIRVQWGGNMVNHNLREFRVYSPDSTVKEIKVGTESAGGLPFNRTFLIAPPALGLTSHEDFRSTREGERPVGWRTSGDWDWFVRASGEMSKTNKLAVIAPQDGRQHGGVFHGASNGLGDGFSMRTMESGYGGLPFVNPGPIVSKTIGAPPGTSGILEVDVNVESNEITLAGNPGRDISFYVRYDMLGSGVLTPGDPVDDELIFERSQDGLNTRINDYWVQGGCFMAKCDWYKVAYTVPTGVSTLRWTYRRGVATPPPLNVGERGIVWIDNVKGLDPPPTPSILGFVSADDSFITPTGIFGYLSKTNWDFINSWMFGHDIIFPRWGYLVGAPSVESFTLGYLFGPNEGKIDGYLLGGSGTVSVPTGIIDGYMAVRPGVESKMPGFLLAGNVDAFGQINGWLAGAVPSGMPTGSIYGSLIGTPSISGSIDGFLNGGFASGTINAYVVGPPGVTTTINSYLKAQDNFSSVFAYMKTLTSITGVIDCYLKVADGDSEIHAYMLVNEGGPYGYLRGTINGQFINGYLFNHGVSGTIDGYLNSQMNGEIDAYLKGAEFASGSIDGYMQVLASTEINGWLMGISGAPSGGINSFMIGVNAPSEVINAFLIGDPDDNACDNHGTVPLPPLPSYTLPTLESLINPRGTS